MRSKFPITIILLLFLLLTAGCSNTPVFDASLKALAKPYLFSTARWEVSALHQEATTRLSHRTMAAENGVQAVERYFYLVERIKTLESITNAPQSELQGLRKEKASLANSVESTIATQITEILDQQKIYNSFIKTRWQFPPLDFKLEILPYLLVVSPRERIESMREITLKQDMTVEQMGKLESEVDKLGVSSLVTDLGGYGGTYPTMVLDDADLRFTLDTVTHEWVHQYLAFTPLGFRYILDLTGIARDYEIASINESVAGMVSDEIWPQVYEKYYARQKTDVKVAPSSDKFDFNREMREIRKAVDAYLAQGQVEQAEQFMEQKRQYLVENGYYIRKLNQAYFAFHGTYADKPTSVSPIGAELRALWEKSASLKDFMERVSSVTSRRDLQELLK